MHIIGLRYRFGVPILGTMNVTFLFLLGIESQVYTTRKNSKHAAARSKYH